MIVGDRYLYDSSGERYDTAVTVVSGELNIDKVRGKEDLSLPGFRASILLRFSCFFIVSSRVTGLRYTLDNDVLGTKQKISV